MNLVMWINLNSVNELSERVGRIIMRDNQNNYAGELQGVSHACKCLHVMRIKPELSALTHLCWPVRSTFAVRETVSLGIMGEPRVPPPVGINGLIPRHSTRPHCLVWLSSQSFQLIWEQLKNLHCKELWNSIGWNSFLTESNHSLSWNMDCWY